MNNYSERLDLPCQSTAQVAENIRPTDRAKRDPQGTRLIGTYDSRIRRLTRGAGLDAAQMPNGRAFVPERQECADSGDHSGLEDEIGPELLRGRPVVYRPGRWVRAQRWRG